jgi:hypothetical protein
VRPGCGWRRAGRAFSLVDNSLVRQEQTRDGDFRFQMLQTIREFATGQVRCGRLTGGSTPNLKVTGGQPVMRLQDIAQIVLVDRCPE